MSPLKPNPELSTGVQSQASTPQFEQAVQSFEKHWRGDRSFRQLIDDLPAAQEPEIYRELACIDLEFRWTAGQTPEFQVYVDEGRANGLSAAQLLGFAFEDYRLRQRFGQPRRREWYGELLQQDVSAWPVWDSSTSGLEGSDWGPAAFGSSPPRSRSKTHADLPGIGSRFHGCTLVGVLGRGAFGCVYLARQEGLANRFVVLKVSPLSDHEPQLLAELQHTHIVPIYSFERDAQWQSICMPFLGLVTLADMRPDSRQLSLSGQQLLSTIAARKADTIAASSREAGPVSAEVQDLLKPERHSRLPAIGNLDCQRSLLWMFARIAEALDFAHSQGVVHGDIKPANILVSDEGNPLLLDFHLASRTAEGVGPEHVGGTLPYMSPQQLGTLESGRAPEARSDLFSLGVVMYELLAGRLPYETRGQDRESIATMIKERNSPPRRLRQVAPAIPVDVETIVETCLAGEGTGGYCSVRQLQEDLDAQLANRPLRHAANRSLGERVAKWTRRHPVLASTWSLTGLFLLVAAMLGWFVSGRLQSARRLEADAASQRFVQEIESAVIPLTVPGIDRQTAQRASESLTATILDYYQAKPDDTLALLTEPQQLAEAAQLSAASFWMTQAAMAGMEREPNVSQQAAELESFGILIDQIVERVPEKLAPEFSSIQSAIKSAKSEARQAGFSAADWLQPAAEFGTAERVAPELVVLDAARTIQRGEAEQALQKLETALASDADNFQAWLLKGHAWLLAGNRERASEAYSFCVALQPKSPWGWFQRGLVRLEQGDFAGSRADFGRCIELEPNVPAAWLNRSLAARASGDWNSALADLSQAIELGCSETRAFYLRSQLYRQLGRAEEAEQDLKQFLQLEPRDLNSWLARGLVRARANEAELAMADFQAARRLVPDSVDAWQNIATVQSEMLKQLSNAVESLSEIIKLRPNDPIPLVTRGVLLGRMEDRAAAHADAQRALQLRSDADVLFRAAGVYALTSRGNQQDAEQALELLRKAAFEDPRLVLGRIEADSDLRPIHDHPEYQKILGSLKLLAEPHKQSNEVKQ